MDPSALPTARHSINPLLLVAPLDGASEVELPGLEMVKGMVLGLIPYALVACVAAFVVGAALWAVGAFGHNPHQSSKGRATLLVALIAALLVGAAAYLVGWFHDRGVEVSAPPADVWVTQTGSSSSAF